MANTKPKLAVYHAIALTLSIIASVISTLYALYFMQQNSSGYGALGEFIILALMLIVTGILLLHSFIVSIIYYIKNAPTSYWGLVINALLAFLLLSPLLYKGATLLIENMQHTSSFEYRFDIACSNKSPTKVLEMINEMPADIEKSSQLKSCIQTAIRNRRIDLLTSLEANQIFAVTKDAEDSWQELIDIVSYDQEINSQDLELLDWLATRGEKFNYKLEPSINFFSPYNICYTNLKSTDAQKFAERLISLGADINAGEDTYTAWYCSRFNRIDAISFLSKHGLAIKNNPDYNSVIGEALANRNPHMIELLINIGARPLYIDHQSARTECLGYSNDEIAQDSCTQIRDYDDLITACTYVGDDGWTEENKKIIHLLQQADFQFEKNPDYQTLEINNAETLKCLKRFEKN